MYIIIHKYQRWSVNGKTKQKYLKKICQRRNKQTKQNILKYGLLVRKTENHFSSGVCLQIKALS